MLPLREKVSWAISPGHAFLPVLESLSAPSCCCKSSLESYTPPLFFWTCFLRLPSSWLTPVALRLFEAALPAMEAQSRNRWVTRKVLFPRLLIPRCIPLSHPELDWNWSPRGACLHIADWTSLATYLIPQAELFVRQREGPGLHSPALAWPPRLSAGRREAGSQPSPQPYPTLCDHINCSPSGSSVLRMIPVRILELVAVSYFQGSSQPRD